MPSPAPASSVTCIDQSRSVFEGFEAVADVQAKKRWMASTGTSLGIYLVIGVVVAVIARNTVVKQREDAAIDVSFHASAEIEPEVKKEPPPPPPPRANQAKRAGRKAPATPTVIPDARPDEAEPAGDVVEAGGIEDFGDGVGEDTAPAPPPPPPPPPVVIEDEKVPDPVALPDDATPCVAIDGNKSPIYPEAARKKGIEGTVVLKLIINERGEVVSVKLIRGDEPFATAAMDAVRTWRYKPALVDGKPWATSLIISIPFRIRS